MNRGKLVFAQVTQHVQLTTFRRCVAQWLELNGWNKKYFLDITPTRGLTPGERRQETLKRTADRCNSQW